MSELDLFGFWRFSVVVISACDTLMTYTALMKNGAREYKRKKTKEENIPPQQNLNRMF